MKILLTPLVRNAFEMVGADVLAMSLCGTAKAFLDLCRDLESKSLHSLLRRSGVRPDGWAGVWSLTDASWVLITHKHPELRYYPLGETAERALKKTVLDLLPQSDATGPADLMAIADQGLTEELVKTSLKSLSRQDRLKQFLANYFFEMAIDYLRRPSSNSKQDSAFDYHFRGTNGVSAVTAATERKRRRSLAAQCGESAVRFLPFIKQSLDGRGTSVEAVTRGMAEVFRARPMTPKATVRKTPINVIVGNWSLAKVEKSFRIDRNDLLWLVLEGTRRNVTCKFSAFEDYLGRPLHSLTKDLLEIGAAVYIADLYRKRSPNLSRQIGLLMKVRHAGVWSRCKPLLERAISELGRDAFTFHFQKKREKTQARSRLKLNQNSRRCVSLFSGGIDSLAGVVWLLKQNLDPILVSHYAGGALAGIQNELADALGRVYKRDTRGSRFRASAAIKSTPTKALVKPHAQSGKLHPTADVAPVLDLVHFSLHRTKRSRKQRERQLYGPESRPDSIMFEHLRSFLFLSAACAIALETGNGTVYIFENGPVALNPLISEGTVNTRTSHPHFINAFRRLVATAFNLEVRIENPFLYKTKGEVVKMLDEPKLRGLLAKSNSCWAYSRVPLIASRLGLTWAGERHEGVCIPCILRRTSVWAAGLRDFDAAYLMDVFSRYRKLDRDTVVSIADLLRFCGNVLGLDSQSLLSFAPDLSVYDDDIDAGLVGEMYRRHSAEVICAFKHLSNHSLRTNFKALLNFPC